MSDDACLFTLLPAVLFAIDKSVLAARQAAHAREGILQKDLQNTMPSDSSQPTMPSSVILA